MPYKMKLHNIENHSRRIVEKLEWERESNALAAGVDQFFLDLPSRYPWSDADPGCLPARSYGGKMLVRLTIDRERVQVVFALWDMATSGHSLQNRAEAILREAIEQYRLRPIVVSRRDFGVDTNGWTVYAVEDGSQYRFWYNLIEVPEAVTAAAQG